MKKDKIILNWTKEQYLKKYGKVKERLLHYTVNEVNEFDKKYGHYVYYKETKFLNFNKYLLKNRRWALIDNTYYEMPSKGHMAGILWKRTPIYGKIGVFVGIGAVAVLCTGLVMDNTGITYKLDSDIVISKLPETVEKVTNAQYPGVNIKKKNNVNEYKVLAFTDLHLDHNQNTCNYTFSMLARNIIKEKPDLVVFCGDNITSSFNKPRAKQFAQLLEDLGVYWSAVLGNHEKNASNPFSIARDRMLNIWSSYPHCLIDNSTKKVNNEKVWGVGNHVINLLNNDGSVTQSLFFLDSGTEMSKVDMKKYSVEIQWFKDNGKAKQTETEFYDYIKDSQVNWYKETFTSIKDKAGTNKPHSTIFTHVPLAEMEKFYLQAYFPSQGVGPSKNIGAFTDVDQTTSAKTTSELLDSEDGILKNTDTTTHLRRREDMCYSPHDLAYYKEELQPEEMHTPIFRAMNELGDDPNNSNNAFFCGHDHQNNFMFKAGGVFMGYIQPGCYSSNNLYTKGMLGADPYTEEDESKYHGDHLIQGYSVLTYKDTENTKHNVLANFAQHENYKEHSEDLYRRAIDTIKKQKGAYKGDKYNDYFEAQQP